MFFFILEHVYFFTGLFFFMLLGGSRFGVGVGLRGWATFFFFGGGGGEGFLNRIKVSKGRPCWKSFSRYFFPFSFPNQRH